MPPSFEDIDSKVEKAQGDKARFLKSKEGLLPHFEFPTGETKEEKHYSKETLFADMYEEKIKGVSEMMDNPIFIKNALKDLHRSVMRGSEREGENIGNASLALRTLSAFITTDFFSRLSPEKQNEINSYLENPILLENAYQYVQNKVIESSEKEGKDIDSASSVFRIFSAFKITDSISRLSPEQQNNINSYLENPIFLENVYQHMQYNGRRGSKKEGETPIYAILAFWTLSVFISTHTLSRLSPEKQNEINSYLENPTLIENMYIQLQDNATRGSEKEGEIETYDASFTFQTFSSLTIVKDYLRARGKKIDEENFAKEALNPTEKIPPRPEGILGK